MQMRPRFLIPAVALIATLCAVSNGLAATPVSYKPPEPSKAVAEVRYVWHDAKRDRDVPVKIYYPAKGSGPFPIIIFSHGLGGNREGYEYLGRHWAGCGYVSVHLQHHGSDDAVWKSAPNPLAAMEALRKSVTNINNAIDRARDVSFGIDEVLKLNTSRESPLRGRLDTKRIGMAGHSFGAWTTLAVVGEHIHAADPIFLDSRIRAAVAMSAPIPKGQAQRDSAFKSISVPVFHMTGTRDNSPMGETFAADRRVAYDEMNSPGTCLVTFNGADHMVFSGRMFGRSTLDPEFQSLICAGSTAFWDAWLKDNSAAKNWLYDGGFAALVDSNGTFEKKTTQVAGANTAQPPR